MNSPTVVPETCLYAISLDQSMESRLSTFIQWALTQTYCKDYSIAEILNLLDDAWEAQKLLWRLRDENFGF